MSETETETETDDRAFELSLSRAVSALPGVLRLEPTLADALRRLSTATITADDEPDNDPDDPDDPAGPGGPGETHDDSRHSHNTHDGHDGQTADAGSDTEGNGDGVTVTRSNDGCEVSVELSATGAGSALRTAVAVRKTVQQQLIAASLTAASVSVRVLALEPDGLAPESTELESTASTGADAESTDREVADEQGTAPSAPDHQN